MMSHDPGDARSVQAERGSATVLGLGVILLLLSVLSALLLLGAAVQGSLRARAAADGAVLAGASVLLRGGDAGAACAAAGTLAAANGARLISCDPEQAGPSTTAVLRVEVAVEVPVLRGASARAVARAGAVPDLGADD